MGRQICMCKTCCTSSNNSWWIKHEGDTYVDYSTDATGRKGKIEKPVLLTIDEQEERFGPRREYTEFESTVGHIMPELVVSDFPSCMEKPEQANDDAPAHTDITWVCHDMHHSGCNGELSGSSEWCHCPCHFSERNGHWKQDDNGKDKGK